MLGEAVEQPESSATTCCQTTRRSRSSAVERSTIGDGSDLQRCSASIVPHRGATVAPVASRRRLLDASVDASRNGELTAPACGRTTSDSLVRASAVPPDALATLVEVADPCRTARRRRRRRDCSAMLVRRAKRPSRHACRVTSRIRMIRKRPALGESLRLEREPSNRRRRRSPSGSTVPAVGDRAEGGVDEVDVLVAGVAEVDEPLPVDRPRHLLQHLHPPPVVLDQVVDRRRADPRPIAALATVREATDIELRMIATFRCGDGRAGRRARPSSR